MLLQAYTFTLGGSSVKFFIRNHHKAVYIHFTLKAVASQWTRGKLRPRGVTGL